MRHNFTGQLKEFIDRAVEGKSNDVDYIMDKLTIEATLATTRNIDFALSLIEEPEGIERVKYYLFKGTLIQRNYASLYFNRIGEWEIVKHAYHKGLIDEIQAYSR